MVYMNMEEVQTTRCKQETRKYNKARENKEEPDGGNQNMEAMG
jgi:hypothetical protein